MIYDWDNYAKTQCRRIFSEVYNIHNEECLQILQNSCELRHYRKKEHVIKTGEVPADIPFIVSGSICGYYVDDVGGRIADCVAAEFGDPIAVATSLESFSLPSDIHQDAMEPLEVVAIPVETLVSCITTYPDMAVSFSVLIEKWFNRHRRMAMWQTFALPARYEAFCKEYPGLQYRITKTFLALCLNSDISAVSRLMKKESECE